MTVEELFRKYKDGIVRGLTRFSGDSEAAEDACSEAFCRALKVGEWISAMPERAALAWINATARNALVDQKRKEKRFAHEPDELTDVRDPKPDFTHELLAEEMLNPLPEYFRKLTGLRYLEGYNSKEIGEMYGLSPATVRTQLRTAVKLLKRNM